MHSIRLRWVVGVLIAFGLLAGLSGLGGPAPAPPSPPMAFAAGDPWALPDPTLTAVAPAGVQFTPWPTPAAEAIPLYPGAGSVTTRMASTGIPAREASYQVQAGALAVRMFYDHALTGPVNSGWVLLGGSYGTARLAWSDPAHQAGWGLSLTVEVEEDIAAGCSRVTLSLRRVPEIERIPVAPGLLLSAAPGQTPAPYVPYPGATYRLRAPWSRVAAYYALILPEFGWRAAGVPSAEDPGLRFSAGIGIHQAAVAARLTLVPGTDAAGRDTVAIRVSMEYSR